MNKLKTMASLGLITVCISKVKLRVESLFLLEVAAVTSGKPEAELWEPVVSGWVCLPALHLSSLPAKASPRQLIG